MRKVDEYRRYANEAQQCADRSLSEKDKAGWLRIAQSWLNLLREYQGTPEAELRSSPKPRAPVRGVPRQCISLTTLAKFQYLLDYHEGLKQQPAGSRLGRG